MGIASRLVLAALGMVLAGAVSSAQEPAAKPPAPKHITWSRTWESALREAEIRNVPIYILVSIGEG